MSEGPTSFGTGERSMQGRTASAFVIFGGALLLASCQTTDGPNSATAAKTSGPANVSALGRIPPADRIRGLSGPSRPSVVIARLFVEEGDRVQAGKPIAELDSIAADDAAVAKARAALRNAEAEMGRIRPLVAERIASQEALDTAQLH